MGNFKILFKGATLALQRPGLAFRLWAVNFIFSLFAVAPFFFLMARHMSHSFSGERTLQRLDIFWLGDFVYRYLRISPAVVGSALLGVALYLLLALFLHGGVIGALNRPGARATVAEFFHDAGLYFWRFLRLFLLSIPAYLLVVALFFPLLRAFLEIFSRRATTEWPALIVSNLRVLVLVLLLTVVAVFFDYVKISLVTRGGRKVLREAWLTAKFFRRRFFQAWGLYLLAGMVFLALAVFYLEIARLLPQNRPLLVLLAFLWQQFFILCRQGSRVMFFATELEFVKQDQNVSQGKNREE